MKEKIIVLLGSLMLLFSSVFGADFSNLQYTSGSFNPTINNIYSLSDYSDFWPVINDMNNGNCEAVTDFALMIPPGGCTPAVVRSDLLAEQNVPVFCQVSSVQLNPLIRVSSIRSLSFRGDYPSEVAAVRFHPANAGAGLISNNLLNNPVINNVGYAMIVLKKTPNESSLSKWVSGNITASIDYDAEKAFGLGNSEFYLNPMDDSEWESSSVQNSFWLGRGSLRLNNVGSDNARVSLYIDNKEVPFRDINLKEGETSSLIYLPGFYCMAGLRLKLNEVVSEDDMALLWVGEDKIWVREGSKILNDRCRVDSITINSAEIGSVSLSCLGSRDKIELSLFGAFSANISVNDTSYIKDIGEKITTISKNDWFVGYISDMSRFRISGNRFPYVVLVSQSNGEELNLQKLVRVREALSRIDKSDKSYESKDKLISDFASKSGLRNGSDFILLTKGSSAELNGTKIIFNDIKDLRFETESASISDAREIQGNYTEYDKAVSDLINSFPQTKFQNSNERFAEKALLEEIELTGVLLGKGLKTDKDLRDLREKFLSFYPDSSYAGSVRQDIETSTNYDRSRASKVLEINGEFYRVALDSVKIANPEDKSVEVLVDGISQGHMTLYSEKNLSTSGNKFRVIKIDRDRVTIEYSEKRDGSQPTRTDVLILDEPRKIGMDSEYTFLVRNIKTNKVAHVSIISEQPHATTEANFTFKIGIEKREFEITPEKANESLEELNKTIAKWEKKLDSFGKLIESWKKVCFFTGLGLQAKNFVLGMNGEALARQEVMKIYRTACNEYIEGKDGNKDMLRSQCYAAYSKEIDKDVIAYKNAVEKSNEVLKKYKTLEDWKEAEGKDISIDHAGQGVTIRGEDFTSWDDVRYYYLNKYIGTNSGFAESGIKGKYDERMLTLAKKINDEANIRTRQSGMESGIQGFSGKVTLHDVTDSPIIYRPLTGLKGKNINGWPGSSEEIVEKVFYNNSFYVVGILPINAREYKINMSSVYNVSGSSLTHISVTNFPADLNGALSRLIFVDGGECRNNYTNPTIRFINSEPNKGMPGVVPFDKEDGWYVKVSQSLGGLLSSEVQSYQESGTVRFFYVCNVGSNGKEENGGGDDICQSFDINTLDKVTSFGGCRGLNSNDVRRLANDALSAIRIAQKSYTNTGGGPRTVKIQVGLRKEVDARVDTSYVGDSSIEECTDFMSPEDCSLMFNVCDPVICPSSRCDFGGKASVDNVIASGVAGSLLLCLPNFGSPKDGKVLVPICLTGVHAGLDGWLSILRAQYSCKEEAIKSGKYVGICDYITSIYKCEFFWRNGQIFLKDLVPRFVEFVSDPSALFRQRGGGEYNTFQTAWNNMGNSLDYFKNQYAGTSFLGAIQYTNVEEFGSEVCRSFIGTSLPTKGEAFDAMFKVDSPTQFYSEFSEIPYTEATVPPTSQYKVLYHVYAGNDKDVSYSVYLKDPPGTSFYQNHPEIFIASGTIAKGKFASESKDFTAPQGYKQLCVVLNGNEKCGFKQVTSDVGIEMITKSQVEEESKRRDITTESQCISGSSSVIGMTSSINLGSGAASSLNPEISQMGLVRVCASENPGKGINDNWIRVGNCGTESVGCWLDQTSVNRNTLGILNNVGTIKEVEAVRNRNIADDSLDETASNTLIKQIGAYLDSGNTEGIVRELIANLSKKGYYDYHQANGYYFYTLLFKIKIEQLIDIRSPPVPLKLDPSDTTTGEGVRSSLYLISELKVGSNFNIANVNYEIRSIDGTRMTYLANDDPKLCDISGKSSFEDCLK